MLAQRRLDINASYGCSLICRFCFHPGIPGDMQHKENAEVRTTSLHLRPQEPLPQPAYVVNLVKYAASARGGLHRSSTRTSYHAPVLGKKW